MQDSPKINLLNRINETSKSVKIHYILQHENIRGTAGALYACKDYLKDEYFALMFGDDLIDSKEPFLKDLINAYKGYNSNIVGIGEVSKDLAKFYDIVKFKKNNIVEGLS